LTQAGQMLSAEIPLMALQIVFAAIMLLFAFRSEVLLAQVDVQAEPAQVVKVASESETDCINPAAGESQDQADGNVRTGKCKQDTSLSNYSEDIGSSPNNTKTVEADLISSDTVKPALFPIDLVHDRFAGIYRFKERINDTFRLAFSVDYTVLAQRASHTEGETNTGSSSVFRILGTWLRFGDPDKVMGNLVWKTETRNPIWGNITPRDLGFTTGSALSTANFKSLEWGITDLYWQQRFDGKRHAINVGHMDPGDWADQYPLLNAWTSFMSDAFYNNPTEAIPKRGFGIAGQSFFADNLYLAGGVHDANGGDGDLDFDSFWNTREWFSWVEVGHRSSPVVAARQNIHLHYWHQDARQEAGTQESRGIAFTYSYTTKKNGVAFVRAGYSRGDAAQMRRFIGVGMSYKPKGRDTLGIATSWGSPPDKSLRDQITSEIFYRVQVTQNITFTPSLQVTFKPAYTLETKWVFVPGFRMRFVF